MTALAAARELSGSLGRREGRPATVAIAEGLGRVVRSDCLALSVWDPVRRRHRTLASSYPAAVTAFLDAVMHTDPLFAVVRGGGLPVRVRDLAPAQRGGEIFDSVITPCGFRDGLTQCLFAPDGRYVGMLNASTLDTRHPDDDAVSLLVLLAPQLGAALDPAPVPDAPVRRLDDGVSEGLRLGADGTVVPLTAAARPDLLLAPSPLLAAARALRSGPVRRLVVHRETVHDVEMYRSGPDVVVLYGEVPPPCGLTVRELQVLARVAEGESNPEAGAHLGIGARTVASHVEHILTKTGCRNRVDATRTATAWGLLC
ncbi:helix-turn-helix transcriptional regulator [Actinomycetospora termitidis]|uniref:Helix-turn-helix transcriptional regulator n=1 Tax=Actinomycetospora termitidis TaxID=3053470 RepID=A0ABT7M642_9PSEU|nr:helix-turn-helix transcriptional regulator [Actinomycetospora sp. Odt1-22]MDL5156124.1 helix-turn-helix transcriptional regulator [Actinomycetospora sp. Odt1-22]